MENSKRQIIYLASTQKDLGKLPSEVKEEFIHGLYEASLGMSPVGAKSLKYFGGRHVVELVEDHRGDTYRAVYTIKFKEAIYVLHVFKKKSTQGISTPKPDIDLIL